MCNIAGYVGEKIAAPILIEMMKKQEGFAGGYYTGIATIHEGKIYHAKLAGDTQMLEDLTEAASLPGTVGILHSRSKSGGGVEWAHPFVDVKNEEPRIAYVANGAKGFFEPRMEEFSRLAETLLADGYKMSSKVDAGENRYNKLSDGSSVHMSDVMCQLILRNIERGDSSVDAMSNAFCEMPSEIVGLMLSLDEPDGITWSRINMPMFVGYTDHGTYMASTPIAFPEDAREHQLLPPCSAGRVCKNGVFSKSYKECPATVAPITARVKHDAYDKILEALEENKEATLKNLCDAAQECFAPADIRPRAALVYDILKSLLDEGKIKVNNVDVDGVYDGITAPETRISLA